MKLFAILLWYLLWPIKLVIVIVWIAFALCLTMINVLLELITDLMIKLKS